MTAVAPVWDGNETWLVMGGGGLLAAFPLAYGLILSALYAPIVLMLLALVFRGVAFEFRWRDPAHRGFWDLAFSGGSLLAALSQGVVLGDPRYYGRFGFTPLPGLTYPDAPADHFLGRVLHGAVPAGVVGYHQAFGVQL